VVLFLIALLSIILSGLSLFLWPVCSLGFISSLYAIYQYQNASEKAKLESEAHYARPQVVKAVEQKRDWKELVSGNWGVTEAEDLDEWILLNRLSGLKKFIIPKVFFRLKHETLLTDSIFQFSRYVSSSDDPNLVVKMVLYSTEEEAVAHANDCQAVDISDNANKSFASFLNEEEKTLTTFICPVDMSGSKFRITHVRKIVDDDCLSVVSRYIIGGKRSNNSISTTTSNCGGGGGGGSSSSSCCCCIRAFNDYI
jgi:hypothetical protein